MKTGYCTDKMLMGKNSREYLPPQILPLEHLDCPNGKANFIWLDKDKVFCCEGCGLKADSRSALRLSSPYFSGSKGL